MSLVWEMIGIGNEAGGPDRTSRAKVPGGWLVAIIWHHGGGVTFYPDPTHHWDGKSLP